MLSTQAADNCWKMHSKSTLAGEMTSIFNSDSIRIDFTNLSMSVVAKGPKWEGRLFSDQTNNYMVIPYSEWKDRLNLNLMHRKDSQVEQKIATVKTGKHLTILEHPCDELMLTVESGKVKRKLQAYVTKDIVAPPQFSLLLKSVLDIPSDKGMPLRVVQFKPDGKKVTLYDTASVENSTVPDTTFVMPKSLKLVTDEMAVMFGSDDDAPAALDADGKGKKNAATGKDKL